MRVVLLLVATVPLSAGCGHREPDEEEIELQSSSVLPHTLHEGYDGRNAQQWNHDLLDTDEHVSQVAAFALQEIGEESLRFVLNAFGDPRASVRKRAISIAYNYGAGSKYPAACLPPLAKLLGDQDPIVRIQAALAIEGSKFAAGLPQLEVVLGGEKDVRVSKVLRQAIGALSEGTSLPNNASISGDEAKPKKRKPKK